jgi:rod shape-determining protein MreD
MNIARETGRLILALIIQVLFFNNLHFFGLCFPFVYITALICMPVYDRKIEMLIGFTVGLIMDICCSSPGMHTAACTLLAWLRPILLSNLLQDHERLTSQVLADTIGTSQFVRLAVILCLLHHAVVFTLDSWTCLQPLQLLLRWTLSSAVSLLCILAYGIMRKP